MSTKILRRSKRAAQIKPRKRGGPVTAYLDYSTLGALMEEVERSGVSVSGTINAALKRFLAKSRRESKRP